MDLKEALIIGAAIDAVNDPFPKSPDQCLASDSVLLACIGGCKWDSNPLVNFARSRVCLDAQRKWDFSPTCDLPRFLPQLIDASTLKREIVEGVDVMVVRELTGDVCWNSGVLM
jgi:3-isopropylmalate dehydrogenase